MWYINKLPKRPAVVPVDHNCSTNNNCYTVTTHWYCDITLGIQKAKPAIVVVAVCLFWAYVTDLCYRCPVKSIKWWSQDVFEPHHWATCQPFLHNVCSVVCVLSTLARCAKQMKRSRCRLQGRLWVSPRNIILHGNQIHTTGKDSFVV